MKRFAIFSMVCLAAAVLFSACGPEGLGGDGNWWTRSELATGIKTITTKYDNGSPEVSNYDKDGRLVSITSEWNDETFTYNADGLITQSVYKTKNGQGEVTYTSTTTYTYGAANKDRYLPRDVMGGRVMHLDHVGLLPGLTRVEFNYDGRLSAIDYSFKGDVLTIKGTGQDEYDNYETTCEYAGAYPNKADSKYEFMGPISYYDNGMFKSYREGFKDDQGKITTDRTTTYKNFDNKLNLPEKMVESYDGGGVMTTTYTYDKYGNPTKELRVYKDADGTNTEYSTWAYEYDSKGMWTKCQGTSGRVVPWQGGSHESRDNLHVVHSLVENF